MSIQINNAFHLQIVIMIYKKHRLSIHIQSTLITIKSINNSISP